ncbi:acyl-CoA thioesterase [Sediminibacterium goheungense]|uniref:Acyl-CoA thioester hydrolase n=1 Tax=Sediminibacterium goheungense TaxID=1086393 RepID=A0A4R6ISZ1_9BACT|nr:acyl-CoA thioesterase [Sediminibacterium goheungense]TDO23503.1 acyl-CoA thioester hydrolase [Sediminibacterium goheungense]TDO25106.1 acyl-CoA thioester hydrolase [Sediminibacterium goheungense]
MATLKKILESTARIQYQDCDPFNHLNNSKYIDYIVAARTEQLLENYSFHTADIAKKDGLSWVAAQTQISYLYPAAWLEKVVIETKLISFSASSLLVEAFMWNENKTHIKAIMWSKLVHFHIKLQKSHKHSTELMRFFEQIHHPLENDFTFENRVNAIRKEI